MGNKNSIYQENNIKNIDNLHKEAQELSYLDNIHVIDKKNLSIDYRYLLKSNIEKNIKSPKNQMLEKYKNNNDEVINMKSKNISPNNINNKNEEVIKEIIMKKKLLERELELLGLGNELRVLKNEIREKQKKNNIKDDTNSIYSNINTISCLTGKTLYN